MPDYGSHSFQDEFRYFPYIIVYLIFIYVANILICFYLFDQKKYKLSVQKKKQTGDEPCSEVCMLYFSSVFCCCFNKVVSQKSRPVIIFDTLYESNLPFIGVPLLFAYRIVAALFIFYYDIGMFYIDGGNIYRFGSWVNISVASYLLFAVLLSSLGNISRLLRCSTERADWPLAFERIGAFTTVLYHLAYNNAVFVTVVQFIYFSPNSSFENMKLHLAPAGALFIDMLLNNVPYRLEHYAFSYGLIFAYAIFQLIEVYVGNLDWMYSFLHVHSPKCFATYSILLATHFILHLCIFCIHFIRDAILKIKYNDRHHNDQPKDEMDLYDFYEHHIQMNLTASAPASPNTSNYDMKVDEERPATNIPFKK